MYAGREGDKELNSSIALLHAYSSPDGMDYSTTYPSLTTSEIGNEREKTQHVARS